MPPWQALETRQKISTNVALGRTESPENDVVSIAVFIVQENGAGVVTGQAYGMGPPKTFEQRGQGRDAFNAWSIDIAVLDPKKPLVPGKARGLSVVQRRAAPPEAWTNTLTLVN
jgi:hypothetical protein